MKLKGKLIEPKISRYYVTGSIEENIKNDALKDILQIIKQGGKNALLNNKDLKNFAENMLLKFKEQEYLKPDDTLTVLGEEIIENGKVWRGFKGTFCITVLKYQGKHYLLNAELHEKESGDVNYERQPNITFDFKDKKYFGNKGKEFRNIEFEPYVAEYDEQPVSSSVEFEYDYESKKCDVKVKWECQKENFEANFKTEESSLFYIIKEYEAMELLHKCENNEGVFKFSNQDTKSIEIVAKSKSINDLNEKKWLDSFFEKRTFSFNEIPEENDKEYCIEDVCLYINPNDKETTNILLCNYLLRKAEKSYLGYDEIGRLITEFQNLFTSSDDKSLPCSPITEKVERIYNKLVEQAEDIKETNPIPYLHLQAYIDLSPNDIIKPYIEKEYTKDFSNKEISFYDLVNECFDGKKRNIKTVGIFSKYTVSNGRNARNMMLFAKSFQKFGVEKILLITTNEEVRPNKNNKFRDSDQKFFEKMKNYKGIKLQVEKASNIKDIHDRYYKIVRDDGTIEWWKMTAELDQLKFENDSPNIREDITSETKGTVGEMTFSKIKLSAVPEKLISLMEER